MDETLIEKYINENGEFVTVPVGTSMYPMLRNRRDSVYMVKYNGKGLKRYDLPVYKRVNGVHVMHRCLGKDENGYIMCGDNQWILEHGIQDEQIIAVVKGFYRDEKYIPVEKWHYKLYYKLWCKNLWCRKQMLRVLYKLNPNEAILSRNKNSNYLA